MDNATLITLISIGVTILFLLGIPIFLVIGFWVVGCSLVIDFTLANVGVTLFEGLSFFGLLALPLFILTGDLINAAGIAKRMSDFAYSILGWVRGGLGIYHHWCMRNVRCYFRIECRDHSNNRFDHAA